VILGSTAAVRHLLLNRKEVVMTLKANDRRKANNEIIDLVNGKMLDAIPIEGFNNILGTIGLELEEAILCGRDSNTLLSLFVKDTHEEVKNSGLYLSWYRFDTTNRYEVIAYLS
jgi:hypothetical protein